MTTQYMPPARCSLCDILLKDREQFIGHMIHAHDTSLDKAGSMWRSASGSYGTDDQVHNAGSHTIHTRAINAKQIDLW